MLLENAVVTAAIPCKSTCASSIAERLAGFSDIARSDTLRAAPGRNTTTNPEPL